MNDTSLITRAPTRRRAFALATALLCLVWSAPMHAQTNARVDDSTSSKELRGIKRQAGPKPTVAIYEFRSSVPDVQVGAAQEMFVTALIKSGAFAVAERQRMNEGLMRERKLNSSGITAGPAAGQVAAARYVFEVVVSEANRGAAAAARRRHLAQHRSQRRASAGGAARQAAVTPRSPFRTIDRKTP